MLSFAQGLKITSLIFLIKVPKCEIFDRSDFHNFYTIKSLWEGDFGVNIIIFFWGGGGLIWGQEIPYAYAQSNFKEGFFCVWAKKNLFRDALRPFVGVNNDFLKFSMFGYFKNYQKY